MHERYSLVAGISSIMMKPVIRLLLARQHAKHSSAMTTTERERSGSSSRSPVLVTDNDFAFAVVVSTALFIKS